MRLVTIHLKSGAQLKVRCKDIKIKFRNGNELSSYEFIGASNPGAVFYVRIDDISAITYRWTL